MGTGARAEGRRGCESWGGWSAALFGAALLLFAEPGLAQPAESSGVDATSAADGAELAQVVPTPRIRPRPRVVTPAPVADPPPPAAEATADVAARAAELAAEDDRGLALSFAIGSDLMGIARAAEWGATIRAGAEWSNPTFRVHLAGGYAWSEVEARTVGGDVYLGGHWRALDWLHMGLYGQLGIASTGLFDPWMERTATLGLEMGQCIGLTASGRLCFDQRVAPIGVRTRRAVMVDDQLFTLPLESDGLIRAEMTVGFRQEL